MTPDQIKRSAVAAMTDEDAGQLWFAHATPRNVLDWLEAAWDAGRDCQIDGISPDANPFRIKEHTA